MSSIGLISVRGIFDPLITERRLTTAIHAQGMTLFAKIDHSAAAAAVGLSLRPTTVLLFGSANTGTPLMRINQTIGLDLPLRLLISQDSGQTTWISYNDPMWIAQRHGLCRDSKHISERMQDVFKSLIGDLTVSQ